MTNRCARCGAPLPANQACVDLFNAGQIKEVENPATYYPVHHLSVPCYMLQHNAYSRQGWLFVRQLLHRFIYEDRTPNDARKQMRHPMDSGQRTWSLTKGEKLSEVNDIAWTRTVADVRLDTAEHYCADVNAWARHILADTEVLARVCAVVRAQ